MAKDYRRANSGARTPPSKRKQNRSCVWWLVVGVAIGLLISQLLSPRKPGTPEQAASPAEHGGARLVQPRFKFEEILSDTEVDVTSQEPALPPSAPRPQPPAPKATTPQAQGKPAAPAAVVPPVVAPAEPPRSGTYVVQVGSFRRTADAERLKAELALLGVSSNIQSATLADGRTFYRVRTGAYANKTDVERVRALLKRHGKDSMTVPIR